MTTDLDLIIGITATRSGLTVKQASLLIAILNGSLTAGAGIRELHHGDCLGGDADADEIACALGIRRVIHPPDNPKLRAYCKGEVILKEEPYKDRNRGIVLASCPLLALPATMKEQEYGGTWGTVRFGRCVRRPVILILPDGTIRGERTHGLYFGL